MRSNGASRHSLRRFLAGAAALAVLLAAGPGRGPAVAAPAPPSAIDVRDFGADPTGARDATAAIQAALDASIGGGGAVNRPVYLPAGEYRVTRTLRFYDSAHRRLSEGGILFGDGGFTSRLNWHGPPGEAVVRSIGAMHTIRDLGIFQFAPWKAAILYDGDPSIGRSTASSFERLMIQGRGMEGDGIVLGDGGFQSDSLTIDKCYIAGLSRGNAIFLKDPNTQSCRIVNCNLSENFVAVRANPSTVVGIYGGQITGNNLDFWVHGVGGFDVTSVRTEDSMKTFWSDGGEYLQPVTFHNVSVYAVNKDRRPTTGSIRAGSDRLTLSGPNFSWGDAVRVRGAGPGGGELACVIYDFRGATEAVVSPVAATTVTAAPVVFDARDPRNEINFHENAYGPYVHVGVTFHSTWTNAGQNNFADNIAVHASNGPQTFIGCAWSSRQQNPFNLPASEPRVAKATVLDCQNDLHGRPMPGRMKSQRGTETLRPLERSESPRIGSGSLFGTSNTSPTAITRFLDVADGHVFEILVRDDRTTFRQGQFLKTATGQDMNAVNGAVYRFLCEGGVAHMAH